MKKVLVTGASGFIGQHSLPLLLMKGYEVHALYSTKKIESSTDVIWHQINLLDLSQVSSLIRQINPTHLLHLAWYAEHGKFWSSSYNLLWIQASLNLIENFYKCGGERIVVAGTCAEYDWKHGYCTEDMTPLLPISLYGICKHSLQQILMSYAEINKISAAWGRIFFLYGPNEHPKRLVSSVISSLLKKQIAYCSHGNQIRDFLYVEDVASAFVSLLNSNLEGVVNIASGKPIILKDLIFKIGKKLCSANLIRLGEIQSNPDEPNCIVGNTKKINQFWLPQYDLDLGIEKTIKWWQDFI